MKIAQIGNVILEDEVEIGSNTTIDRATLGSTIIKRGAKIGPNGPTVPDVTIGEMALVGAGSVVISNIAPETVVAGYPAKMIIP